MYQYIFTILKSEIIWTLINISKCLIEWTVFEKFMTFDQNGQSDLENSHGLGKGQMQIAIKYIAQWRIQIDSFWLS